MIVTDTSFLFSLFGNDAHTAAAQGWVLHARQPISITALNRYEFSNAIRFAAFRKFISQKEAIGSIAAFDADVKHGNLLLTPCDFVAIINEADRLSERYTLTAGHRSLDVLQVATARILKAKNFLTFDVNQQKLAVAAQIPVAP